MLVMTKSTSQPIGPHDLGGAPADEIDLSEHDITFWEQRIDAMVNLLAKKDIITDWAQLREGIEALPKDSYDSLSYYERWAAAAFEIVVKQGVVTREEVEQKINSLQASRQNEQ